ncbi:MerR family transcriptional regulator [Actinacidiphila glaucinigra]|uniref:MerR family transcriptional regulator n=1 Tax=Actinacidiphila glaucinigra TaxID=235986 RepID=UPI002DDBF9E5|nr:MerR family transcriptional regulator [Actinacidiphila glaucinigra]WSD58344.1 MerR family transcriptional regulator [Actinacidiphila glaucinigra]
MNGDARYSIGDLARRTGLTVKTIRFYSDRGIVTPAARSPAGYRRYDGPALARLELVRTLRDLGLDLATIRRVVDRELSLPEVAAAHAAALEAQIRTLRVRRAVLTAVARRGSTPEETELMHELARLSAQERGRLIDDFLDAVLGPPGGLADDPALAGPRRSLTPALPDDAHPDQLQAWVELAELSRDPGFRDVMRRAAEEYAADRARAGTTPPRRDVVASAGEQALVAVAAGVDPASERARPVVAAVAAEYADQIGVADGAELRRRLLARLRTASDPRRERYARLLAVVNGWPVPVSRGPALDWAVRALEAGRA